MWSYYDDDEKVGELVRQGEHRGVIGGRWEELGQLQLDFMRSQGLMPNHRLLDVGCGSLRAGVRFVDYLDPGNYYGFDRSQDLLDAGYDREILPSGLADRLPRSNLRCIADFDASPFDTDFDYALAQSVFTHLPFNPIRDCLTRISLVMRPGGIFFATFFEVPEGAPVTEPFVHEAAEVITHSSQDPYHYRAADLEHACVGLPWQITRIGEWGHPRAQQMMVFTRQ